MKKVLLPILVLLLAGGIAALMIFSRPKPESREPDVVITPVEAIRVEAQPTQLLVHSQGTVFPDQQATIAAEVGGLVVEASPRFETGLFVEEGEILLQLDSTDYEAAVSEAEANLLSAQTSLIQAEADAAQAIRDLQEVGVENPSALARREPQLEQARLRVDSARAALDLAEKNLERTGIKAPFDGQIIETLVDRGDVLSSRGTPVGVIYGTTIGQVRLPLSRENLRHLNLPSTPQAVASDPESKPKVTLTVGRGEDRTERTGWIDRLEGNTDSVTRLRGAIARFRDPLDTTGEGDSSLPFGSFVTAKIEGLSLPKAFRLPIVALVGEDRVRVIDAEGRLQEKKIFILQRNGTDMVITDGLEDGDLVCLTPLEIFAPGMPVRIDNGQE